jgi:K+-transporting ATPase KdpF subunit
MRQAEIERPAMNTENGVMVLITVLLLIYLVYALLRPEEF